MIPWIIFPSIISSDVGGDDDGDLTNVILQASFDDRLKSDNGVLSVAGTLATLTAQAGKDLYLTAAKITFALKSATSAVALLDNVELQINGVSVEHSHSTLILGTGEAANSALIYEFKNIGHKVTQLQDMKLEVVTFGTAATVEGVIQAIEVPVGENPATYTGS